MRLLHFNGTGNLILTDFSRRAIPPYAILSHRWGNDEVRFADIACNSYTDKAGSRKISFCAEQASRDGLQYFWIDTCCIDTWSRVERSKAINSMFRWYRDAAKCYVFLADVTVYDETNEPGESVWKAAFRTSEWFTRGWTLQELIAPRVVEFYSSEGCLLGDKTSLEQLVHVITGVPIDALAGSPLESFDRRDRMAWAEKRKTTEPEDKAYCLLGILNVSMPTTYGEGGTKAWSRLVDELESDKVIPHSIPFARNLQFVSRESQLDTLEARLFADRQIADTQTTVLAIAGAGGTGKSQLALELAYRTKVKHQSWSIFWIDASDTESIHQSYVSIAQKLNIANWNSEQEDVKLLVKLHLERSLRQWLLVFDSVDNMDLRADKHLSTGSTYLDTYLPQSPMGSAIFTTTDSDVAKVVARQNVVYLEALTPETAQTMLLNQLNLLISAIEKTEMDLLLEELSHLPLAIAHAAAFISKTGSTLQEYRSQIQAETNGLTALRGRSIEDDDRKYSTDLSATATTIVSLRRIHRDHTSAAEHLFLMACVDRKDIPLELLGGSSSRTRKATEQVLHDYALVTRRPADSSLDVHRLVHAAVYNWLGKQELQSDWTLEAAKRLLDLFPDNNHHNRSRWRRLLPHAKCNLVNSATWQENGVRIDLMRKCGAALFSDGRWEEAEQLDVQVIEARERTLGEEHPSTLTAKANLASTYRNQGRWKEAEQLDVQVIEASERTLGEEHPDTLTTKANLASTYSNQGRWKEAEQLEVQVIEASERTLGEEHLDTLTAKANLASTYRNQGRWKEAEQLEVQVIEASERTLGEEHPNTLTAKANLASTYSNQGRWKEAEQLEVQVIEARERTLGEEHPDTLTTKANLALTYSNQGRWKEAEQLEVQVIEARERTLGEEHPSKLTVKANLASTYRNQGRWKEAEQLEVQVIEARERTLGEEHPDTLTTKANLASTYRNQGRWKEAEQLEVQVIEARERTLGEEHPDTLTTKANLALTYSNQGRWKEAEQLEVQVIEARERTLGEEHPDTLTTKANLASTYRNQGRWKEAGQLEVQVIEARERTLGEEHPDTLTAKANLAYTLRDLNRFDDATELMERSALLSLSILGHEHPDTLLRSQQVYEWKGSSDKETTGDTHVMDSLVSGFSRHDYNVDDYGRCSEAGGNASDDGEHDGHNSRGNIMTDDRGTNDSNGVSS